MTGRGLLEAEPTGRQRATESGAVIPTGDYRYWLGSLGAAFVEFIDPAATHIDDRPDVLLTQLRPGGRVASGAWTR